MPCFLAAGLKCPPAEVNGGSHLPTAWTWKACSPRARTRDRARLIRLQRSLRGAVECERRLTRYLQDQADYQKNRHRELAADARQRIDSRMGRFLRKWGYPSGPAPARREAA